VIPILTLGAGSVDIDADSATLLSSILITCVVFLTWIYLGRESRHRGGTMTNKYGPLFLVMLGGLLMLAEPMRYELHDANFINLDVYEPDM